jgi:tRNA (cmo5U34)-methyltransferase
MQDPRPLSPGDWGGENSRTFLDQGRYFVPDREAQIAAVCALVPPTGEPFEVLELCTGAGLLAEALLERFPACTVHGLDGSPVMIEHASARLARFGARFKPALFDLAALSFRDRPPVRAIVSSLAVHHLDGAGKQRLFRHAHRMLLPGGALIVADVIAPSSPLAAALAADAWDDAVKERARAIDGHEGAFEAFEREQWNMYRHPIDPDGIDKPSGLFDQLKWLEQAGFVDIDVVWMKAGHAVFGGRRGEGARTA